MAKRRQLEFLGEGFNKTGDCFGGSLLKNSHAKTKRPIDSKLPLHLVLRSDWAQMRLPRTFGKVNEVVRSVARKHGVKTYDFANVGNHLHFLIKLPRPTAWSAFIRELTGRISQIVQGISGQEKGRKFWSQRPYTRIVRGWKKPFQIARQYIELNHLEADGIISRIEIKTLKDLRLIFADG